MQIRYPIQYDLSPKSIDPGMRWLTLTLKNIGTEDLMALDVRFNSLDVLSIIVTGTGNYIPILRPNEERVLPFQVSASTTGSLYASLDGWRNERPFH